MKLLALSIGTLILGLVSEPCSLKESLPLLKVVNAVAVELISTGVQVNLGKSPFNPLQELGTHVRRTAFLQSMYRQTCPTPHHNLCHLHRGPALTPLCHPVHKLI